jgi:hypothetical protein
MLRTYEGWTPEFVGGKTANAVRSMALFALAWFHAIVQERRNYIPQVRMSVLKKLEKTIEISSISAS